MASRRWTTIPRGQDWTRIRALVLERDGHRCRIRIHGRCTNNATHVHHTQAREVVGDRAEYLVAACGTCNRVVGDPTAGVVHPTPTQWWTHDPDQPDQFDHRAG